jgi:hypothetical protein
VIGVSRAVRLRTAARRVTPRARSRWRAWVNAVLSRYVRRPHGAPGPERVLAKAPNFVRERWIVAARTLLPQIHLSIHPVLRHSFWHARTVFASRSGLANADVRPDRSARRRIDPHEPVRPGILPADHVFGRPFAAIAAGLPSRPAAAPLRLVFQRLREPEGATVAWTARRAQGAHPMAPMARRVAEQLRRVEQISAAAPARVIARRDAPASVRRTDAGASRGGRDAVAEWSDSRSTMPALAPQPAVAVAALADRVMQQIDDRLRAWHERTGF